MYGICAKPEAALGIVPVDSLHEPQHSLLHQYIQEQAVPGSLVCAGSRPIGALFAIWIYIAKIFCHPALGDTHHNIDDALHENFLGAQTLQSINEAT